MKILYLTTGCFDKGGISRYCRYQIEALRELFGATNITVLSLLGPDGTGFETLFVTDWRGQLGGAWDKIRFSHQAIRQSLTGQPDVIHVAHVNLTPLAFRIGRMAGARTLLNVYGREVWSGLSNSRRRGLRAINRVVADCHFTSDYIAREQMHSRKPDVIWDCVNLEQFSPGPCPQNTLEKYGLPDKRKHFVVMSLGRLDRGAAYKGFDRLIEVFSRIHRQVQGARLVIAGKGDDRPRLEALAASKGIGPHVSFVGAVDEADLADVYRSATVFSLVSDRGQGRGEGIPLTPLEAMSCGVPIIVGDQDGSREAVVSADCGFVIDPFDLDRHAEILLQQAEFPDAPRSHGVAARRVAESFFGYERFVEQHGRLYEDLMTRRAPSAYGVLTGAEKS